MPTKPKRPCSYLGCPELVSDRYCNKHQKQGTREFDDGRGSAAKRGYDHHWRRVRKRYLAEHPLCVECERKGKLTPSNVVDHIVAHKGDHTLFWDESNWQPLCTRCHNRKTRTQDMYQEYKF